MVTVAVAGGTGGIGRHIVEGILATRKHNVVVLSRSSSHPALEALGAQIIKVDYNDHASLVAGLQGIHTVISTILSMEDANALKDSQLALLRAAVGAGVKRFAPSEFAVQSRPDDVMKLYRLKTPVSDAISRSGLEWTIFENGVFMNYFAVGTKGKGYLNTMTFVVDVQNGTARVPNTGDQKVNFTRTEDVGAFVAASLDLKIWPERSGMVGDVKTYNEVIALAEKATGKKFKVTYISQEELCKEMDPEPPSVLTNFNQEAMIATGYGSRFHFEPNLNPLCPEVKPMGAEEFLQKWWGDAQL